MKQILFFIVIILSTYVFSESIPLTIYGEDNRHDLLEIKDIKILENSKAVATRVHKSDFKVETHWYDYARFLVLDKLKDPGGGGVCSDEKFANQVVLGDCSGFLIKEDLLATAAHCVTSIDGVIKNKTNPTCQNAYWVFNYANNEKQKSFNLGAYPMSDIYRCKKVLRSRLDNKIDYAVIQLDRAVKGVSPLKLSGKREISKNTQLYSIGYPLGLPQKVTVDAKVLENDISNSVFQTNLDTFHGSSGSPVFNAKTHEVVGILVGGRADFVFDEVQDCNRLHVCSEDSKKCNSIDTDIESHAEEVTKIKYINNLRLL